MFLKVIILTCNEMMRLVDQMGEIFSLVKGVFENNLIIRRLSCNNAPSSNIHLFFSFIFSSKFQ